jgi:hypothetical protein
LAGLRGATNRSQQLRYFVQLFKPETLKPVAYAYSLLDAVPRMLIKIADIQPLYRRLSWMDAHLMKIQTAFIEAQRALTPLRDSLTSRGWRDRLPSWRKAATFFNQD